MHSQFLRANSSYARREKKITYTSKAVNVEKAVHFASQKLHLDWKYLEFARRKAIYFESWKELKGQNTGIWLNYS